MWNYSLTLPTMMILVIILCYYFFRPRIPLRMNRTFLVLLALEFATIAVDYTATRADEAYASLPQWMLWASNMAFFLVFLARIAYFLIFTLDALELYFSVPQWVRRAAPIPAIFCGLIVLSSLWTGAIFRIDSTGYHSGPLYVLLNICYIFYPIVALVILCRRRKQIVPFGLISLLFIHLLLLIGAVLRTLLPRILIMNTFCVLAILIAYLSYENPELFLSDRGKAFNLRGFRQLIREWHPVRPYQLVGFSIRNYQELREVFGGQQMDACITQIIEFFSADIPDAIPFYLRSGSFVLILPFQTDCHDVFSTIESRFHRPWQTAAWDVILNIALVQAGSVLRHASADRMVNTLLIVLNDISSSSAPQESFLEDSIEAIDRQIMLRRCLEKALNEDQVEVFLQPIVSSSTEKTVAAEALARIRDLDGNIVPPESFISLAERDGQISRLGIQVFRKVCAFIQEHREQLHGLEWINVNLSPQQCLQSNLPDQFSEILKVYGVSPQLIHLEVTEHSIEDTMMVEKQLKALQDAGFQLALDDYGSGYSNLTRLLRYSFRNIKLDIELVQDYMEHPTSFLPSIMSIFHQMNFSITAEGIESREMADAFQKLGCDYFQGFYFAKPMTMEGFARKYLT